MTVVWGVLGILFIMSLFPMQEISDNGRLKRDFAFTQKYKVTNNCGRHSQIDTETTLAQMLPVIIFGAGLLLAFKDKTKK